MVAIRPTLVFVLGLFAGLLVSCGQSPSEPALESTSESSGQPKAQASQQEYRLAALSPAMAVMIRDLGHEDWIVAKHDHDMVLSDQVPAAGSEIGFDLEILIQADPTHLFFQKTSTARSSRLLQIASERGWILFERPLNTLDDIAITMDDLYYLFNGPPQIQSGPFGVMEIQDRKLPSESLAVSWDDLGPVADAAGRVLVLGSIDPIGAMGPGSYHHQLIHRLGATPAMTQGAMWIELDYEDLIALNPDSIILILPRQRGEADHFGEPANEPAKLTLEDVKGMLGPIGQLPISAIEHDRIGVIDHPLGLLPSGSLGDVAQEMAELMRLWASDDRP